MSTNMTTFIDLLAMYQLFVSIKVLRSPQYIAKQRIFQLLIIWIIPFFGALLCHIFILEDRRALQHRNNLFTKNENPNSDAMSGYGHDHHDHHF